MSSARCATTPLRKLAAQLLAASSTGRARCGRSMTDRPAHPFVAPPDRVAVVMAASGAAMTYRELADDSARLANVLQGANLPEGSPIAILLGNCPEYFVAYWGILRAGHRVTTLSTQLTPDEAAYIVGDCHASGVIVGTDFEGTAARLAEIDHLKLRLAVGTGLVDGYRNMREAVAAVSTERPDRERLGNELLYSSGTTGAPKGIWRPIDPNAAIDERTFSLASVYETELGFEDGDVYLSPAPLYHASPLRFCVATHVLGGTVVVQEKFDAEGALKAIEQHQVTHSQWVPTMFVRMLQLPSEVRHAYDLSSLRVAVHSAAPCPDATKRAMVSWWGPILWDFYGASEAIGRAFLDPQEWSERPGSVGRPDPELVRICDESGAALEAGRVGTIYFKCVRPFEYFGDPEKTARSRHPEDPEWVTVGDVGRLDSDGYLYLADRQSFVIISGGVNIYPQEVENALVGHRKVADAVVVGRPDPEFGESVVAFVEPEPEFYADPELIEDIQGRLRRTLARFKHPKWIEVVPEVPRTPGGKPDVAALRELASRLSAAPASEAPDVDGGAAATSPVGRSARWDSGPILVDDRDGVRTITFNRPEVHNAQNLEMLREFDAAIDEVAADRSVRVLVIAGAGRSFCSGHDLRMMGEDKTYFSNFSKVETRKEQEKRWFVDPVAKLRHLPIPTVCRIQGHCLAAGLMFAAATDFVVAGESAIFGSPILMHMGVNEAEVPNFASKVGESWAKRVFWLDERLSAEQARQAGLVTWVVPDDDLDSKLAWLIERLLRAPRQALELSKESLQYLADLRGEAQFHTFHFMSHQISHATHEAGEILNERLARLAKSESVIPDHESRSSGGSPSTS
ncbi:AMP-binding protein [Micromonospora sp. NPDC048830]|uniref:AMP-binding protein n=1 Tax=Micromonospora sp. NPDC048830 TaxID=3364257 RepID=UPI00372422A3